MKKLSRGNVGSLPVGRQEATRWDWKRASLLMGRDEAPHWEGRNFPSGKGRSFLEEASCWEGRKLFIGKGEKLPGAHTSYYPKATLREGSKLSGGKKEVG